MIDDSLAKTPGSSRYSKLGEKTDYIEEVLT